MALFEHRRPPLLYKNRTPYKCIGSIAPQLPPPASTVPSIGPLQRPSCTAINVHRRFRELAALNLPYAVFLGLCAYLHALRGWRWEIAPACLDSFICAYPAYRGSSEYRRASYHAWFQAVSPPSPGPPILTAGTLDAIADENQYTFGFVRESLLAIAQHRGLAIEGYPPAGRYAHEDHGLRQIYTPPPAPAPPAAGPVHDIQFRPLDFDHLPVWHDKKALRVSLEIRTRDELAEWLRQDWVFDTYEEYCVAVLDTWRSERADLAPAIRRSSAKFVINSSVHALCRHDAHFLRGGDRADWTPEEHDICFITRLVTEGRRAGRWWERCNPDDTAALCTIGYRLMCWLRHIHRLVATTCTGPLRQRAADCQWFTELQHERACRARHRAV